MTRLLEKHKFDIQRRKTKQKHTYTDFAKAFNKDLMKQFFRPMGAKELQDLEKVFKIWVKNLNIIVK